MEVFCGCPGAAASGSVVSGADPLAGPPDGGLAGGPGPFWAAVARGVMTKDAAGQAGVSAPVGFRWFRHAGGVNPALPSAVSGRYLSFAEREDIAIWHAQHLGVREIARRLGRDPSTISRELRRNVSTRTYRLDYKASIAQWHTERRARRPKVAKLVTNDRLRQYVQDRLSGAIRTSNGKEVAGPPGPQWKGPKQAAPRRSPVGHCVEPGADRQKTPDRVP